MESYFLSDKEKNFDVEWFIQNNEQLFETVKNIFKSQDEKNIGKVCSKLTSLFKENDARFQDLIINCIPILLKYYFIYFYEEKICSLIEVCLLTIYNLSLPDEKLRSNKIRLPNLSLPSVYHSPQNLSTQSELSESAISKLETEYVIIPEQFKPILDTINSEKRFKLIRYLIKLYYSKLPIFITKSSKIYFCDMCLKMCKINRATCTTQPIHLTSDILIEMLYTLFYLFKSNLQLDACIAIEAISIKADEELMTDVILMCNSMKNVIQNSKNDPCNLYSSSNVPTSTSNSQINRRKSVESSGSTAATLSTSKIAHKIEPIPSSSSLSSAQTVKSSTLNYEQIEVKTIKTKTSVLTYQQDESINSLKSLSLDEKQEVEVKKEFLVESSIPPPVPSSPRPSLSNQNSAEESENSRTQTIPNIDETSGGENDDDENESIVEKL